MPFNGSSVVSGGESHLVDDPASGADALLMLMRVGSASGDLNHAIAQSSDGGQTWGMPHLIPEMTGPSCSGSIARRGDGTVLVSAPNNWHWRYPADRRNLTVWALQHNASAPSGFSATGAEWQIWAGPAAYSGLTREADFVMWEGGLHYRYESVMVAPAPPRKPR